jgi:sortase A
MYKLTRKQGGGILIVLALVILVCTYLPVLTQEVRYLVSGPRNQERVFSRDELSGEEDAQSLLEAKEVMVPVDEEFGIVIPKISANAKVHQDVDWQKSAVYQKALQTGVAHAQGTSTPDKPGNMFLFAHSGIDFYEAARYNAEFYLLGKLDVGDSIYIFYQGEKYLYTVTDKKIVASDQVQYLMGSSNQRQITLMTCWPAGTTFQRLIITGERNSI